MIKWEDELELEDIPEKYQDIAVQIGIDNLLRISLLLGGIKWDVPKTETIIKSARDKKIVEDLKYNSAKRVARKYGLTQRYVMSIAYESKRIEMLKSQISLFDRCEN